MTTRRMITAAGTTWPERYTYSPALRVGNLLFLAGTTATDKNYRATADLRRAIFTPLRVS